MAVVFKNNAKTTLASSLSSSATSVSVADGSVFPSLGSGEVFFCTLDDGNNNEIVKVTAVSSNTLTVVRAQESTTARSFSSGDAAELRLTAGILSLFSQTGVAITDEIEAYLDANGLTFPDSVKAQFGASNDLQIFHDGNNSILKEAGTGNLRLQTGNSVQFRNGSGSDLYFNATLAGATTLFHNKVIKLATTTEGIDVTGLVTIDTNPGSTYGVSEALRIDDSAGTSDRALQIFEFLHSGARSHRLTFNTNITTDGSSAYTYTQGNYGGSSQIEFGNNGPIVFYTNAQNTAGSTTAITPTERLRIKETGEVQVQGQIIANGNITLSNNSNHIATRQIFARDTNGLSFKTSGGGTTMFYTNAGDVTVSNNLTVSGNATFAGDVKIGSVAPQTNASLNLRRNGTNIEFGHNNRSSGFYGTLGAFFNNGHPYLAFSADANESGNTFNTRGFKANIIKGDTSGNLIFAQVTNANATGQTPTERFRIDASGSFQVQTTTIIDQSRNLTNIGTISSGAITSSGAVSATVIDADEYRVQDTRNTATSTDEGTRQVRFDFKSNSNGDSLNDGGSFHGQMLFQQWNDSSGGDTHALGFTDNGNIWHRRADIGGTWDTWYKIVETGRSMNVSLGTISSGYITAPGIDARAAASTSTNTTSYFATSVGGSSSSDDWQNSPISIRERGLIGTGNTANKYSPNINFHWANAVSRSLSMDVNGDFHLGEYNSSGSPIQTTATSMAHLNARGYKVGNTTVITDARKLQNVTNTILLDGTLQTTPTSVWGKVKNTNTGTSGYSELHILNDADQSIRIGSIGSGYTNADWAGSRYIYSSSGELRIKAATNLRLYSGGFGHTGDLALTLDTSQNATFAGSIQGTSFSDGTISGITFIDEDSFSTNSATRVPTQQSVKAYVDAQVAGVVDSAPSALNTLNELAAALGDDSNFATTTSTSLGNRLRVDTASQGLTATQQGNAITNLGITATKAELNFVDGVTSNIQTQLNSKLSSFDITTQTDPKYLRSNANDSSTGVLTLQPSANRTLILNRNIASPSNYYNDLQMEVRATSGTAGIGLHRAGFSHAGIYHSASNTLKFNFNSGEVTMNSGMGTLWGSGNDGAGSGLDADSVDGVHAFSFLRSDAADTSSGNLTFNGTSTFTNNILQSGGTFISHGKQVTSLTTAWQAAGTTKDRGILPFRYQNGATGQPESGNNANWGLNIYAHAGASGNYPYGTQFAMGSSQNLYFRWWSNGSAQDWQEVWTSGNDGSGSGLDSDTVDGIHAHQFLRSDAADTASGSITFSGGINVGDLANGGITGSNYNITGVNTLVMNDPGEGIQFGGTSNVHLAAIDDSTDSVMNFANASELRVNNNKVWTVSNDGTGSGLDADLLDGVHASSFLRSDASDSASGTLNLTGRVNIGDNLTRPAALNSDSAAHLKVGASDVHLYVASLNATGGYKVAVQAARDSDFASFTLNLQSNGGALQRGGNTVWDAGNDGSGSGLDADTVDGIQGASYLRSDANDSYDGILTMNGMQFRQSNVVRNLKIQASSGGSDVGISGFRADGTHGFQIYGDGTNYGFLDANWANWDIKKAKNGQLQIDEGSGLNKVWSAGNDGSGSGLDADTLDGIQATGFITNSGSWMGAGFSGSRAFGMSVNGGEIAFLRDHPNTSQMSILVDGGYHAGENNGFYSIYSGNNYSNKVGFYGDSSGNAQFTNGGPYFQNNTPHGYIQLGPMNTSHAHIYTDRTNFYFNKTLLYANGNLMWHAGNDGSGSGLDADTLDGTQLSAIYTNSAVANTSVNKVYENSTITYGASYLQWMDQSGNGGTGQNGANPGNPFNDWHHHLIMNHGNSNGYYVDQAFSFHHNRVHFRRLAGNNSPTAWYEFWHTGNDGSGSGLDADLLDGVQGSSYLRSDTADTLTGNITLGNSTKLLFGNSSNYGVGAGGHNYRSVYVDTVESGLSNDPLELVYYQGPKVNIGPGGNKPMNAGSFEIGGTSVINSSRYLGNIDRLYLDGNFSGTYLTNSSSDGTGYLQVQTSSGYTRIGAGNSTYSHFFTDRGQFYFNRRIVVDTGNVSSYDEDLSLQRAGSTIAVVKTGGLLLRDENALFFDRASDGGSDLSTKIYADDYPDGGYSSTGSKFWVALESKGGTHIILNSDGATSSGENNFDHFTIFQDQATHAGRQFYVTNVGNVHAKGDITAFQTSNMSDIRLKKNIKPLENCLDKVLSLNGVSFDWKDENKGSSIGFIAQDFEKTVPELVQEKPDISDGTKMHKSIQYANLNAMLVEAIKEQQDQIEYLKSELIKLKENNNGSND